MPFSSKICLLLLSFILSSCNGQTFTSSSSSWSFSNIVQSCSNGRCQTCIDDECYDRNFGAMRTQGRCPPAVCGSNSCSKFVIWHKCSICVCNGTGYQNPCRNTGQCDSRATCLDNLCTFTDVPANLPAACSFDHECPELESCSSDGSCEKGAARRHAPNVSCVFDRDCPSGFQCSGMTCYEASPGAPDHVQDVNCVFRYQCPNGYYCDRMSCFKDPKNRDHIPGFPCTVGCPDGYNCIQMTCVRT